MFDNQDFFRFIYRETYLLDFNKTRISKTAKVPPRPKIDEVV